MNEELLKQILTKLTTIEQSQNQQSKDIAELKATTSNIEGQLSEMNQMKSVVSNIEGQLSETNQIVKVLLHRTEELDAKYDGLLHNTATRRSNQRIFTKGNS